MAESRRHGTMGILTALSIALLPVAFGCSEFMYNSTTGSMSARSLDQGYSWDASFMYVPKGARLQGLATNSSNKNLEYTAQYGFALTAASQQLYKDSPALGFTTPPLGGSVDGLNSEGLSAAVLYDPNGNETFSPTQNASETEVSMLDWVGYALATYANVEEARVALTTGAVTVTKPYSPLINIEQDFATPYHSVLRDPTKDQLVVEFSGDGVLSVYSEPSFVLTNGPSFLNHLAQRDLYLSSNNNGERPAYLSVPQSSPLYQNVTFTSDNQTAYTTAPSQWWPFPGDYSSASRFIRLSMLNKIAQTSIQYPNNGTWSPAAYPGTFPYKSLFDAAESFLVTVMLPLGVDDKGGVNPPDDAVSDFTQLTTMRDHENLLYWYKTPASPQWKLIDVGTLASRAQPTYQGYSLASNYGANRSWFEDVTAVAAASPEEQEMTEALQQEITLLALSLGNK